MAGLAFSACLGPRSASTATGGEVTGVGGTAYSEPTPYGMVFVKKGSLKIGTEETDSLWGMTIPTREISVDGFWMDANEVSNAKYRQFVFWVRDSIIRERLADPAYAGDETYKIEEDKFGNPVTPYLNWKKPIPWKRPNEDELRAIESVYVTNPATGERMLDARQMNYRYEVFDYTAAALRKHRLNPDERNLNTDHAVDADEVVMISKDTAYIDDEGRIVRETITRPLSGLHDFLNTYIVNIYPDTTCWVNDFSNAENERYMLQYFSNPAYNDYPVVGVTWEQANAFCDWRTEFLKRGLGAAASQIQPYRLPTEVEWEFAARGPEGALFPWETKGVKSEKDCYYANFKPDRGDYTELDNLQMRFLFGQFQRFVRHGGKCGGMDEYGVHRIGCGRHERHESGTEIQCRERRSLSPEKEVGEGRFVERPGIHDTFRMAFIRISKPTAFVHRFPLCTFCVGDNQ